MLVCHLWLKFLGLVDHLLNLARSGNASADVELGIDLLELRLQIFCYTVTELLDGVDACLFQQLGKLWPNAIDAEEVGMVRPAQNQFLTDAIRPSQHAALKQTLSKSKVNGRPIYGASQEDRPRFASFVATTNNPHPLTDATGSRRYICLTIPDGQYIDNSGEICYEQLYAQVVYELKVAKTPYWFSNDEVARIQQLNQNYLEQKDIAEMVEVCFRKPKEGEAAKLMNSKMLLGHIQKAYPSVEMSHGNKVRVGNAMNALGYESAVRSNVPFYKVIPLQAA